MPSRTDFVPFMNEHETRAIEACLALFPGPVQVLEWGSGRSSVYFSWALPPGSHWTALEHDTAWARTVLEGVASAGLRHVTLHQVPNDAPFRDGVEDGDLRSFRSYVTFPAKLGRRYDVVLVDGRARIECLRMGWELLADGGVLILHDAQRREYEPGYPPDAVTLRMVNRAVESEGPISVLFMARAGDRLAALADRLRPTFPPEVVLSGTALQPPPARVTAPAPAAPPPAPAAAPIPRAVQAAPAAPPPGAPSCVIVNTCYPEFLRAHYQGAPALAGQPYQAQLAALQARCFGDSDFYSEGLRRAGWAATDLVLNCEPLQARWAAEQGLRAEGLAVAVAQIRALRPTVVYLQNLTYAVPAFVDAIRPYTELVVGQIASKLPDVTDLRTLDLVISSFPHYVERFRAQGLAAFYQPLAFDPRVLERLPQGPRDLPLTFVGGVAASHTWTGGTSLLERLAATQPLQVWGYGAEALPPDSAIRARHRGEAWGLDMFGLLGRSLVTFNRHGEIAERFANNMRLFEATGCGALLVTDHKDNLDDLFKVGEEVVAYRSPEECLALVDHYLRHPAEAAQVAAAGQRRALRDHTYTARMAQTAELLEWQLRRARARRAPPVAVPQGAAVTTAITPIAEAQVSAALRQGWKDPAIPARQRALVDGELDQMYRGQVPSPYAALAEVLGPVLPRGASVLEIGCASGYYHEALAYLLGDALAYTGVDYSEALVEMARRHYPRARFEVADGAALPFEAGAFEVAVSSGVLLHVTDWQAHVREAARVASGWVVAHRTPVRRRGPTAHFRKQAYGVETVELRFAEEELLRCFEAQGLRLMRALELHGSPADDEYWVTYLFAKPGATITLPWDAEPAGAIPVAPGPVPGPVASHPAFAPRVTQAWRHGAP